LIEESPALSDHDRLELTRYLLEVLRGPEGAYQRTFRDALEEEASVRHNHAMLPALDAYFGGHYFRKYYGLSEAESWIRDAGRLFESQEAAFKTECDATAYESTASLPLAVLYALSEPDYAFLSNGTTARAVDRFIGCTDNRFELSGNGDVYPAFPTSLLLMANWYYRDGRYQWVVDKRRETHRERDFGKSLRYHIDGAVEPIEPVDMIGTRCFPVDPEFYRHWGGPEEIPDERRFDKISFRADFDPDAQYLLLDGLQMGSHGHDDVNAIIRFTDHDRVFLVDDSYSEGPNLKDHNAVTVFRDGLRGEVPKAAELLDLADLGRIGFSRSAARDHSGTDWIRSIAWAKDDYFVVIDDVVAREPGEFKMACLWRTLGDGAWEGPAYRTRQGFDSADAPDDFRLQGLGADRVAVTAADEEFLRIWKDYGLAEPTINVVRQGATRRMEPGDQHRFTNLFYASNSDDARSFHLRSGEAACAIVAGDATALVGSGSLQAGGVSLEAELFHLTPSRFALAGGSQLMAGAPFFASRSPVSVELDLESGDGIVVSEEATSVGLPVEGELRLDGATASGSSGDGLLWIEIEAGRHEIAASGVMPSARQALAEGVARIAESGEEPSGPPAPAPDAGADGLSLSWTRAGEATCLAVEGEAGPALYVGERDGRIRSLDPDGETRWTAELGAPVTALHVPDAAGVDGVFAGSEESHVAWLEPGGKARWLIQLPPLHPSMRYRAPTGRNDVGAILAVPGERQDLSVFVGTANGWLRALDVEGRQRWEHFGNARAFDQLASADLDGSGQPVVVVTGQPSHFGACYAFSLDGEQEGYNGLDAWARVTTRMRLGGGDAVICGTALGNLYRLRGSELRKAWMLMLGDEVTDLEVCGEGDSTRILVASHSGYAYAVGMDGTVDWASNLEDPVIQIRAVARGTNHEIAAGCSDGRIVLLDPQGGKQIGQYTAPAAPAVLRAADLDGDGDSEILAVLADGSVLALKR
jgi:outer membrane protein assembly factor BamB